MDWQFLTKTWRIIRDVVLNPEPDPRVDSEIAARAREEAPVVWLVGKVQSGKTSIVRAITGHPEAEIGMGFQACTRTTREYDFPPNAPVIRFLDTRGLGEVGYDPSEDLAALESKAHVVLAVARAMDPQQDSLVAALRAVRKRHPDWAVVLAQTCLHEGYPDAAEHPPYERLGDAPGLDDLRRSIASQAKRFKTLPGSGPVHTVPVDLTPLEEGYRDPDYGLDALLDALEMASSQGMAAILRSLRKRGADARALRAHAHVLGYAGAAGATDALPFVGLVSVPTIQGKMLHSIARIYGLHWDRQTIREFAASLGAGTITGIGLSFGARQLAKLVPVYGQTVGAAAAATTGFAVTYALGRAACYYLGTLREGRGEAEGVTQVYRQSLQEAFRIVRTRKSSDGSEGEASERHAPNREGPKK
jgi:uncharacterized protein (DUF697 family)